MKVGIDISLTKLQICLLLYRF